MKTGVRKQIGAVLFVILLFLSSCASTHKTQTELGDAEAYYNRGNAYWDKGQLDQAILDYNRALELNPGYAEAYNNRGVAYRNKGQYDQAILDYNKAFEINPRFAEVYYIRAVTYYHKKDYGKSWEDVHLAQSLGYKVLDKFLDALRKASGREN
ncbi:MAG: hypothetical protein A2170_06220 [Deltaproteobacteria bacterium RBG_13_53_10]|nr:MAG: hypothetical protein A2170_06220 [Deltaproteobacteria bacterium RBG_13_53_10]